jgi:hypothetical protein
MPLVWASEAAAINRKKAVTSVFVMAVEFPLRLRKYSYCYFNQVKLVWINVNKG